MSAAVTADVPARQPVQPRAAGARKTAATSRAAQVFAAGTVAGAEAVRLAALIDPVFLAELGWDRQRQVLHLAADHPLLGWKQCRLHGCDARAEAGICQACRAWLAGQGIDADHEGRDLAGLPPRRRPSQGVCSVPGCQRVWRSARVRVCESHATQWERGGTSMEDFLARTDLRPYAAVGPCLVVACDRQSVSARPGYCACHRDRFYRARGESGFNEMRWRSSTAPVSGPGVVVLRGLTPLVMAEFLLGLQGRVRDGLKVREDVVRHLAAHLRMFHVATLAEYGRLGEHSAELGRLAASLTGYVRAALLDPETERVKDIWDLAAFAERGRVDFTAIIQGWLRQCAKDWAIDDLTRRRGRKLGTHLRQRVALIAALSDSLSARPDRGQDVTAVGRADLDSFLQRLACAEGAGRISRLSRIEQVQQLKLILSRMRMVGVTRPGRTAAGLSDDFALEARDVPARPGLGEPCRDLPGEIMTQLCAHLDLLTHREGRVAIELLIDTGRRPQEICALPWDCLARDGDGSPVLIYENHKAYRRARRLPIAEATAQTIIGQQERARQRFPDQPITILALLPTTRGNPAGTKSIAPRSLDHLHRQWVQALPVLHTSDGSEFDKARVIPYAYRHTYAQRHADAGIAPDVLRELMDHQILDTTKQYYRVGEKRRRQAVDRLTSLHFDRHGNRIWASAATLLDSEHTRRAVGEVAVPFGVCREPSNVAAAGAACPFRFRCVGCDHFRTDASYLPDLTAYLDDLLRTRERLTAAITTGPASAGLDGWAAAEAMPSMEEITRMRTLIARVTNDLDALTTDQRADVDQAVAVVRQHRTVMLGMPRRALSHRAAGSLHLGHDPKERPA